MTKNPSTIADTLWNDHITPDAYGSQEQYFDHTFEQYKIFLTSADQTSNRRNQTNTFFLTLHTFLILGMQFLYEKGPTVAESLLLLFPLLALLTLCYVWWRLLKSYRQLNSAKYKIIGEYEKVLPSSPYVRAEWTVLGRGEDPKLYTPLTNLENYVPLVFAGIYIFGTIFLIFV